MPLARFQLELLDLAFQAATAIPVDPHIKDRSRIQASIASACLTLDQPRRALRYIANIKNWRRGSGYADLAVYLVRHGNTGNVQHYLDLAREVAEEVSQQPNQQAWRSDRIKTRIADAYIILGNTSEALKLQATLMPSESGSVNVVRATVLDPDDFDDQLHMLDQIFATGSFDQARQALDSCTALFNRFYNDEHRRALLEQRIKTAYPKLPVTVRIQMLLKASGFALQNMSQAKALDLLNAARHFLSSVRWLPETRIPLMARMAKIRYQGGSAKQAHTEADAALALYRQTRKTIVNIYRAGALRPLAATYHALGDNATALQLYKLALDEGLVNPNSRPRAEDLAATCQSMALNGFAPDSVLFARMHQVLANLKSPW